MKLPKPRAGMVARRCPTLGRMTVNRYRFRSMWHLDAPVRGVYTVLDNVEVYPAWWPEVRSPKSRGCGD